MIHFEQDQATRKLIEGILRRNGVTVKPVMEQDNIETMKRGVEANIGISILPEASIARESETKTLLSRSFAEKEILRPVGIIFRKGRILSEPVKRLLAMLKQAPDTEAEHEPT